ITDSGASDVDPTVSPDSAWVAFLSNRDGAWKIWAAPATGGEAQLIAPMAGDVGNWLEQNIQWIP
ncbi:MAG: PD40 domain-containing protein, partial [Caldilineaceae bacterium]|nr:PD40 domain-containing protein [Caldilineaceae bacterium]